MRSIPVALRQNARSLDHLSTIHRDDIAPLGASDTAAVLLPGAEFMGAEQTAPARDLIGAGAIVVLATDGNPGTSPIFSLPLIVGLGVRRYGLSTREALLAVTLNASYVLDLNRDLGSIELDKRAFAYWHDAWGSLLQLLLNVALLVVVGAAGLSGQRVIWRRLSGGTGRG